MAAPHRARQDAISEATAAAAWHWVGASLGAATFLRANVAGVVDQAPLSHRAMLIGGALALAATMAVVAPRALAALGVRPGPVAVELPFAGLALIAGATVVALGGYVVSPDRLGTALSLIGAGMLGVGLHGFARAVQGGAAMAACAVAAAAGAVLVWAVPGVLTALPRFGLDRVWILGRPDSPATARAYLLLGIAAAVLASIEAHRLAALAPEAATGVHRPHAPARRQPGSLLEVADVDVCYGPVQVLFGVSAHVQPGECVALLGTNGAGKSTLLRAAFGLKPPAAGRIFFDGRDITGMAPEALVRHGMVQVPGGRGIFPSLTVAENLRMTGYSQRDRSAVAQRTAEVLERFPNLAERLNQPAGVLSGGEQQMLALARAYTLRPRLLAIDELTLGLAPKIVEELLAFVEVLKKDGIAMVLVEQSVNTALTFADRAYFMERGEIRFEGAAAALLERPDLLRSVFLEGAKEAAGASAG